MNRKNLILIPVLVMMCSLSIIFIQGVFSMHSNASTVGLKKNEILSKLSRGMTPAEVKRALGKPALPDIGSGMYIPVYISSEGIRIELCFNDENYNLSGAYNVDGIDLLSDNWTAEKANFGVRLDGEEVVSSNPIVTISGKTYIPLKEFEKYLGIKVEWSEESGVEIIADK